MFSVTETVIRSRRTRIDSPLSADGTKLGEWTDPLDVTEIHGCWVDQSSSNATSTADRITIMTSLSLYGPPTADVRAGDRIETADGQSYDVKVRPASSRNPWTGWSPLIEIPLTLVEG